MSDPAVPQDVTRRRVFFLPGFDPLPPRRYREMYQRESTRQAQISKYEIDIAPGFGNPYHWTIESTIQGQLTHTRYEFLEWHDIVQSQINYSIPESYLRMYATLWHYLRTGAMRAMIRLRPTSVFAASYSVVMLHLYPLIAILIGTGCWHLLVAAGVWPALAGVVAVAPGAGWMILARRADKRLFVYYLLFDYLYTASERGAYPSALNERLEEFAARIQDALAGEEEEILVVGHSSGAHLAASVMARLPRDPSSRLSFLTLRQAIPMLSFLPGAGALRRDLHDLSTRADIFWLDVSAPGDGACFALSDPVAVSGAAPRAGQRNPKVISAAFRHSMSPEQFRHLRWRFFHRHIQYLRAFERPQD